MTSTEMIQLAVEEVYRLNAKGRHETPIVFTRSEFEDLRRFAPVSITSIPLAEQTFCRHPIRIIDDFK